MAETLELFRRLSAIGQEHLVRFWDRLGADERRCLVEQIESLDLEQVSSLLQTDLLQKDWSAVAARASSPPAIRCGAVDNRYAAEEARACGERAIRAGKVAAVLVAGGQGTRLGFPHPKGMYPLGPLSGRTLFQILADQLLAVKRAYNIEIPLFLMTSPATQDETLAYWSRHHYLGLTSTSVKIFCQGTMPAIDAVTGRLLLEAPGRLSLSPDGHGGTLAALSRSGFLLAMQQQGIEHLFYFQVDNPLVQVCDEEFIGYHILAGSEMSTQVVAKRDPGERVGNVVQVDGRLQIIEYSDLSWEAAERRNSDGSLVMWAGNTAIHVFDRGFLERAQSGVVLPFHRALKKVATVDDLGGTVLPDQPNAVKFERFIFDLMPYARNAIVMEVRASERFSPVKNAAGDPTDSPETAQAALMGLHRSWLRSAGVHVHDHQPVEINPRFARTADELRSRLSRGSSVAQPTYFDVPD